MRSVAIVVEGRTEERFVEEILQVFVGNDVWLRPIVAHTKRIAGRKAKRGGGGLDTLPQPSPEPLLTTAVVGSDDADRPLRFPR